ncbi:aspartic peptidase domain-containing protein [Zopfochytrium polystomum]|nr:aspartic peptidase domain-containing protein [Zopfochytrium polystomum]
MARLVSLAAVGVAVAAVALSAASSPAHAAPLGDEDAGTAAKAAAAVVVPAKRPTSRSAADRFLITRSRAGSLVLPSLSANKKKSRRAGEQPILMTNSQDLNFAASAAVGNQSVNDMPLNVVLDTGSSDTWFRGASGCNADDGISCTVNPPIQNAIYREAERPGSLVWDYFSGDLGDPNTNPEVAIIYGSAVVGLLICRSNVSLSSASVDDILVGYSVYMNNLNGYGFDGFIGLGLPEGSTMNEAVIGLNPSVPSGHPANFIQALSTQKGTPAVFGFYLSNTADSEDGEFTIGGYDTSRFDGPLFYFPIATADFMKSQHAWELDLVGADSWSTWAVGNSSGKVAQAGDAVQTFIVDTGSSFLSLPDDAALAINRAIDPTGGYSAVHPYYVVDCEKYGSFPDVVLTITGVEFRIPQNIYVTSGNGECFTAIAGIGGGQFAVFGDTFLRAYYSVYDMTNRQVGLALAKHGGKPASASPSPTPTPTPAPSSSDSVSSSSTAAATSSSPSGAAALSSDSGTSASASSTTSTSSSSPQPMATTTTTTANSTAGTASSDASSSSSLSSSSSSSSSSTSTTTTITSSASSSATPTAGVAIDPNSAPAGIRLADRSSSSAATGGSGGDAGGTGGGESPSPAQSSDGNYYVPSRGAAAGAGTTTTTIAASVTGATPTPGYAGGIGAGSTSAVKPNDLVYSGADASPVHRPTPTMSNPYGNQPVYAQPQQPYAQQQPYPAQGQYTQPYGAQPGMAPQPGAYG